MGPFENIFEKSFIYCSDFFYTNLKGMFLLSVVFGFSLVLSNRQILQLIEVVNWKTLVENTFKQLT